MNNFLSGYRLWLVAMTVLVLASVSAGQPKAGGVVVEQFMFENSQKEIIAAERGRLFVPENRRNPNSRLIELAFVRFKSTAKQPGAPIVYLAGGPGGSGIAAARGARFGLFMAMREFGDVIALDQRGTGASVPNLGCPQPLDFPLDQPPGREALLKLYRDGSRRCAEHWRSKNVDLRGYNTEESADDIESLRVALGAPKISLWGISYGTHLGLATIRRHGRKIERAILAGVEGPDHTEKLPSTYRRHLEDIDRLVAADPEASKLVPDFLGLVHEVVNKLDREPATVEAVDPTTKRRVKVVISGFLFRQLLNNLYGTDTVPYLPYIFHSASKGDYSLVTYILFSDRSSIGSAMHYMMDCASNVSPVRHRRLLDEAPDTLFADINFPFMQVCEAWGSPDLGAAFRLPIQSTVPVLFISGTLDAKTPPGNAEEVRRGFPDSTHLVIDGAVHSDPLFLSSLKIKDAMVEFMGGNKVSATRIVLPPMRFPMRNPLPSG